MTKRRWQSQLADLVAAIAGVRIVKRNVEGPQGVRGRNSDNARLRAVLGWEPRISLAEGLARSYAWIEEQVRRSGTAYDAYDRQDLLERVRLRLRPEIRGGLEWLAVSVPCFADDRPLFGAADGPPDAPP
jgi:hypothetical protein